MLNRIVLMGRLTRDPELRKTQSDTPVCSFSLAVDRDYKRDGEKETDFIDVVAWRSTAEFVSRYFAKGRIPHSRKSAKAGSFLPMKRHQSSFPRYPENWTICSRSLLESKGHFIRWKSSNNQKIRL